MSERIDGRVGRPPMALPRRPERMVQKDLDIQQYTVSLLRFCRARDPRLRSRWEQRACPTR